MDSKTDEPKIIELEKMIENIIPSHMGADAVALKTTAQVQYYQLKKTGYLLRTIDKTNDELGRLSDGIASASIAQEKQSNALILWTKVMAVAIVMQAVISAFQIYISFKSVHH